MPPLPGILQEGPGMDKAPTLWTRLVFPSTSRCHFVFSINFVYPKSLNLQISWQNRTEFPKFTPIPPVTNIWYHHSTPIWRNKPSNSNSCYSLNLASPPWAGVLETCFPAGGFPFGDRGGFESYRQILAPVSLCLAVSSLSCTSALPVLWAIPSESINQNKSPFSLVVFVRWSQSQQLTGSRLFLNSWFLRPTIPGRMLHYSYLFTGPKHPAGPDSFLDLTLNGLNTRLSSTRETLRRKRDLACCFSCGEAVVVDSGQSQTVGDSFTRTFQECMCWSWPLAWAVFAMSTHCKVSFSFSLCTQHWVLIE